MLDTSAAKGVQSVSLSISVGERQVAAHYTAATPPTGHPVVAALLLDHAGPWRLFARLAADLADHGYPVLALDSLDTLPSAAERQQALSAAAALLRERGQPASLVLVAPAEQAALASAAAIEAGLPGLALLGTHLPPSADVAELDVFEAAAAYAGSLLVLGAGETEEDGGGLQGLTVRAAMWREARAGRHLELGILDGPR